MIFAGTLMKTGAKLVFDHVIGQALAATALFAVVFFTWLWQHDNKVAARATNTMITELNVDAEKLSHEAVKSRLPADRPGAVDRLRKRSCTDCDG